MLYYTSVDLVCEDFVDPDAVVDVDDVRVEDVALTLAILLFIAPGIPLLVFLVGEMVLEVFVVPICVLVLFNERTGVPATLADLVNPSLVELVPILLCVLGRVPVGILDVIACGDRSPRVGEVILVDDTRAGDVTLELAVLLFVASGAPLLIFLLGEIILEVFVVPICVLALWRIGVPATLAGLVNTSSVELVLTLLRDLGRAPVGMPDGIP